MMCNLPMFAVDVPGNATSQFWSAFPSIFWGLLALSFVVWFKKPIRDILTHLAWRLKSGSSIKLGPFDLGGTPIAQSHYAQPQDIEDANSSVPRNKAIESQLEETRLKYWAELRKVTVVHKLLKSNVEGQLYDILIYLIPHKEGTLACVKKVEYYFGKYWNYRVFTEKNRSTGFMIRTSAYGSFLCIARIHFTDAPDESNPHTIFRYIDFEMGAYAPPIEQG